MVNLVSSNLLWQPLLIHSVLSKKTIDGFEWGLVAALLEWNVCRDCASVFWNAHVGL